MIRAEELCWSAGTFALKNLSFSVEAGTYAVLMGRSGSGKTSLIELLCGLRAPHSGKLFVAGRDVTELAPGERKIGFVPQDGALFPTYSVRAQLAFPLKLRGVSETEQRERVERVAAELGIEALLERQPDGLSGGERQRVALGRALCSDPAVLLLDEPLSALDEDARESLLAVLKETHRRHAITVLHVTHSRSEAERVADRILRLDGSGIADEKRGGAAGA